MGVATLAKRWIDIMLGLWSRDIYRHGSPVGMFRTLLRFVSPGVCVLILAGCGVFSQPDVQTSLSRGPLVPAAPRGRLRQPVVLQGSVIQPVPEVGVISYHFEIRQRLDDFSMLFGMGDIGHFWKPPLPVTIYMCR